MKYADDIEYLPSVITFEPSLLHNVLKLLFVLLLFFKYLIERCLSHLFHCIDGYEIIETEALVSLAWEYWIE